MIKQPQVEEVPSALLCLDCASMFQYVKLRELTTRDCEIDQCPLCGKTAYCSRNWWPVIEKEEKPMDKFDKTEFGVMCFALGFLAGIAAVWIVQQVMAR